MCVPPQKQVHRHASLHKHGRTRQPHTGLLQEEQGQEMKGACYSPLLGADKAASALGSGATWRNQRQLK